MDLHGAVVAATEYIHRAYGRQLTVADIAARAYVSPTYFARVFRVLTGYTVMEYVSRYRLYRATLALCEGEAARLREPARLGEPARLREPARLGETLRAARSAWPVRTARPVLDIALECGFGSQQAFTRSFVRAYAVTPAHFRRLGIAAQPFPPPDMLMKRRISMELQKSFDAVRFVSKDSFLVVGVENDVYYATGYDAIGRAYKRWKEENLIGRIPDQVLCGVTYGMTHESIQEGMSKYLVGVEVSTLANLPAGLVARRFEGCEYAVFDIVLADEGRFWKHFYGTWLGEMGFRQPGMITTQGKYPLPTLPNYEVYDESYVDDQSVVQIYAPIER